jgi:tetratricopeptide (TPR) repeat protein
MCKRILLFLELIIRSIFPPFFSLSRIEKVLKKKLGKNPNDYNVLWFLAILYLMDKRYLEAQAPLETLITIRKDIKDAKLKLSQVYFCTQQYDKVVGILSSPGILSDKDVGNYYLGISLLDLADYDGAIKYLSRYLSYYSKPYEAFFGLGYAYFKKGLCEQALKEFKKAEKLNPSSKEVKYNIGLCIEAINEREINLIEKPRDIH